MKTTIGISHGATVTVEHRPSGRVVTGIELTSEPRDLMTTILAALHGDELHFAAGLEHQAAMTAALAALRVGDEPGDLVSALALAMRE